MRRSAKCFFANRFRLERNNGAKKKGVPSCFISRRMCCMKGRTVAPPGCAFASVYPLLCALADCLSQGTHFPSFCLRGRLCRWRYKKVGINVKSRCGLPAKWHPLHKGYGGQKHEQSDQRTGCATLNLQKFLN